MGVFRGCFQVQTSRNENVPVKIGSKCIRNMPKINGNPKIQNPTDFFLAISLDPTT